MAESSWNFQFLPPRADRYSAHETAELLVHSVNASGLCQANLVAFSECRKMPEGRLIDPEVCQSKAQDVISCFAQTRQVPQQCVKSFNAAVSCIEKRGSCDAQISEYLACER